MRVGLATVQPRQPEQLLRPGRAALLLRSLRWSWRLCACAAHTVRGPGTAAVVATINRARQRRQRWQHSAGLAPSWPHRGIWTCLLVHSPWPPGHRDSAVLPNSAATGNSCPSVCPCCRQFVFGCRYSVVSARYSPNHSLCSLPTTVFMLTPQVLTTSTRDTSSDYL